MKRSFTFDLAALLKGTSAVALAAAVLVISAADADAQRRNNNNDDDAAEQNRTVSSTVPSPTTLSLGCCSRSTANRVRMSTGFETTNTMASSRRPADRN